MRLPPHTPKHRCHRFVNVYAATPSSCVTDFIAKASVMPTPFRLVYDFVATASFLDSSLLSSPLDRFLRRLINDEGAMSQTPVSDFA